MPNGNKMTGEKHSNNDKIIYNTPQESLGVNQSILSSTSTRINLRSIQDLVKESQTTQSTENVTYTDPVDESMDMDSGSSSPSPSSSPSSPPSSPPSSGGGGYGGGY